MNCNLYSVPNAEQKTNLWPKQKCSVPIAAKRPPEVNSVSNAVVYWPVTALAVEQKFPEKQGSAPNAEQERRNKS